MTPEFRDFLKSNKIYKPSEIDTVLGKIKPFLKVSYLNKKTKYMNIPASFDIEASSFYSANDNEKTAIMYVWSLGLYGVVLIGRTWDEFINVIETINNVLDLSEQKRLIIYVHNLGYDFQFMRKWFKWDKVFSIENRKPIYAITGGIEFRCSFLLSGYSLEKLGDNLQTYDVKKLVGNLDYEKIRHSETYLTDEEIAYSANDVKVVMAYIQEKIEQDGNISRIPLTKTGYVRNYCRNQCFYERGIPRKKSYKRKRYLEIMESLTLTPKEYLQLKRGFQGGYTHSNPFNANKILEDVTSFDFTSSYPCVMVAEKFPMSKGEYVSINSKEDFNNNLKLYCCLFDIEFEGLQSKLWIDSYISISRCRNVKNAVLNNGRVVSADTLTTTVTEQDFLIIKQFYTWEHLRITNFIRYKKGYLPTDFVKAILTLYKDKTTLKDVEGSESIYVVSKEMLNSCYGMCVTDIVRPEIIYDDEWREPKEPDLETEISKYNNSTSRFLFYPWGVWVTAYARRNLFTGICEFGGDYIYSDTDSIKVLNAEKHMEYITKYNDLIRRQLIKAMEYHNISVDNIEPQTIKGVKKCLGVWDFDGHYEKFKTLGAKRYLVKYSNDSRNKDSLKGQCSLTVSGLNKKTCIPYLIDKYGENGIFEAFNNSLYIPRGYTGKNTHTYIDDVRNGEIYDYLGVKFNYNELSGVHLEKADYSLKLSREYLDYLLNVETIET